MLLIVALVIAGACFFGCIFTIRKVKELRQRLDQEQKTVRALAVLNDISSLLYKDLDAPSIIETIVEKANELIRAEFSALLLIENSKITDLYTSVGKNITLQAEATGILGRVVKENIPQRSRDREELEEFQRFIGYHPEPLRNILAIPVLLRNELIGEIVLANRLGNEAFTDKDEDLLLTLGFHAAFALEKARLHQDVTKLATIDGLTGLNNHRTFQERLVVEIERAKRFKQELSLLLLDIDYFKRLNDTYGHRAGDEVLKKVACRLAESMRNIDFTARYGGEEFVVILPETPLEGALFSAERLRKAMMHHTFKTGTNEISLTVSIGVAAYPGDASQREDLIERADKALYAAKHAGRNKVCSSRNLPSSGS